MIRMPTVKEWCAAGLLPPAARAGIFATELAEGGASGAARNWHRKQSLGQSSSEVIPRIR